MPFGEWLARGAKPIGTAVRQPVERGQIAAVELHTVRDQFHAMTIIQTPTVAPVQELARDIGRVKNARFLILKLMDAAPAAAVAQCFPFATIE